MQAKVVGRMVVMELAVQFWLLLSALFEGLFAEEPHVPARILFVLHNKSHIIMTTHPINYFTT